MPGFCGPGVFMSRRIHHRPQSRLASPTQVPLVAGEYDSLAPSRASRAMSRRWQELTQIGLQTVLVASVHSRIANNIARLIAARAGTTSTSTTLVAGGAGTPKRVGSNRYAS